MSAYKIGFYIAIVLTVFVTSSLLAGAGVTNGNWYPAPQSISRLLIVVLSMFGAGTLIKWCYKRVFPN